MIHFKKIKLILILFILSACSSIPKNTQNSCAIFEERYLWYKHSKAAYKKYSCGVIAKKKLIDKINSSKIRCISSSKDRYKRFLATCYKDKINLNKWMVRNGNAVAYKRYSKDYVRDEAYAKENKLGVWEGSFMMPEKWRKLN